jgi:hypothetical protein
MNLTKHEKLLISCVLKGERFDGLRNRLEVVPV